jgi:hypothetical protein
MAHSTADPLARLLRSAAPFATPRALGLSLLRGDPQDARIEPGRREALVEAALDDGRRMADQARERWGNEPAVIASDCGLSVVECDAEQGWGTAMVYADYNQRTRCIRLFLPAIARLERGLRRHTVCEIAGVRSARPMLLAHELYHHLDAVRAGPSLARQHRVTLLALGRWRWTSGLTSLSEIAAGAFAQRLLGLRWHPRFFDLITLYEADAAAAVKFSAALRYGGAAPLAGDEPGLAT